MSRRFPQRVAIELDAVKYLRIRSGDHRFIAVWVVVVDSRVLVRSWNDKPAGWYRAFLREPRGAILIGNVEIPVRGARVVSRRLIDAASDGYAAKYNTKANLKYVRGFRTAKRATTTLELLPDS